MYPVVGRVGSRLRRGSARCLIRNEKVRGSNPLGFHHTVTPPDLHSPRAEHGLTPSSNGRRGAIGTPGYHGASRSSAPAAHTLAGDRPKRPRDVPIGDGYGHLDRMLDAMSPPRLLDEADGLMSSPPRSRNAVSRPLRLLRPVRPA